MEGYSAKVKYASIELTAKQRIAIKDTSSAIKLDEATKDNNVIIAPEFYAIIEVHNEKSDTKDYEKIVIQDKDSGERYTTGSKPFISTFVDIWDDMSGEDEEWKIEVYPKESTNYKGKTFLTCRII